MIEVSHDYKELFNREVSTISLTSRAQPQNILRPAPP